MHPTPYLRVLLSVELLRRMGFHGRGRAIRARVDDALFRPAAGIDAARGLLLHVRHAPIPLVVEALCYQPFAEIGNKALAEVYRFGQKEQRMIEECAQRLAAGTDPGIVPERFLIGAARYALDNRLAGADTIREGFYRELARR